MRRRQNQYTSIEDAQTGIKGWKQRQAGAIARKAERDRKSNHLALFKLIQDRDEARTAYTLEVEKRDKLAARIAADASALATARAMRARGGTTPAAMMGLLDSERNAPLWMASAEAEVDRARSMMHDAQARHDAGMATHAASFDEGQPEAEPVEDIPRGRGRPRKGVAA